MGTNYYVRLPGCENACKHCAKAVEVHVGKSSFGWRFLHRAYRTEWDQPSGLDFLVTDRASWLKLLDLGPIFDEYDREQDRAEFLAFIDRKQDGINHCEYHRTHPDPIIRDPGDFEVDGYDFCGREFS